MNKLQEGKELKEAKRYLNRLLSFRPRSEKEIVKRFTEKGFDPQTITWVIEYGKQKNLLNDRRFARSFVEDRLTHKPKGKFALRRELQSKGIDEKIIEETLQEKFREVDVGELIRDLAQKRLKRYQGEDKKSQYRKTTNFLKRRGFPPSDIHEIVRELVFKDSQ